MFRSYTDLSQDGSVANLLSFGSEVLSNNTLCLGKSIEWDLWEKMMFGLELHATHQHEPPEIALYVVSASHHLVVDETHVHFFLDPMLALMISN